MIVLAIAASGALAERPSTQQPDPPAVREFTQVHMGMPVRLRFYAPEHEAARVATLAFARIATLDSMMSDYRADSEVRRLSTSGGTWTVASPELFDVLSRAIEIARATDGAFDPTVGPLVTLWRGARTTRQLPDRATLDAARAHTGFQHLRLDRTRRAVRLARSGMQLDLGGIAKGYILQQAVATMAQAGVTRALAEAGGDIAVSDAPPDRDGWRIDVGNADPMFAARAARLRNASLATSGPASQFIDIAGVQYSHVIDPRTGVGLTNHVTARVIADDGATADALATALTIVDADHIRRIRSHFPNALMSVEK